jgi:hypothetical protein
LHTDAKWANATVLSCQRCGENAIGGCALSVTAAISYIRHHHAPRVAGTPILLSVVLTATGFALTTQAELQMVTLCE